MASTTPPRFTTAAPATVKSNGTTATVITNPLLCTNNEPRPPGAPKVTIPAFCTTIEAALAGPINVRSALLTVMVPRLLVPYTVNCCCPNRLKSGILPKLPTRR